MSDSVFLSVDDAKTLVSQIFVHAGVTQSAAKATAAALVNAERDGQKGHGLSRVASYCEQIRSGKVDANAEPTAIGVRSGVTLIDAAHGFAYPALDLAISELKEMAPETGIAMAGVRHSHHFGQAERLAAHGLMSLIFGNTPKAIAFWGGTQPMMGTNPIAFATPMPDGPPLVIDLALSVVARGKIMTAKKNGTNIPDNWAFDAAGHPTTDPAAALQGSMAPLGGAKGAALAMMVELMAASLTASNFGFEASSFLDGEGKAPNVGCILIAIDPTVLVGGEFMERMDVFASALSSEVGARLPGQTRLDMRGKGSERGLELSATLIKELNDLAGA